MPNVPDLPTSFRPGQTTSQHRHVPFPGSHQGLVDPFSGQQISLYEAPRADVPGRRGVHNKDPLFNGGTYALILGVFGTEVRLLLQDLSEASRGQGDPHLRPIPFPYDEGTRVTVNARAPGAREPGAVTALLADGTFTVLLDSGGSQNFALADILIFDSIPPAVPQVAAFGNVGLVILSWSQLTLDQWSNETLDQWSNMEL